MDLPKISPVHVFSLLLLFWCLWLYTEITEYLDRDAFVREVDEFMHTGDRFTKQDGDKLEAEVDYIGKMLHAHMEHSAKYTQLIINMQKDLERIENAK